MIVVQEGAQHTHLSQRSFSLLHSAHERRAAPRRRRWGPPLAESIRGGSSRLVADMMMRWVVVKRQGGTKMAEADKKNLRTIMAPGGVWLKTGSGTDGMMENNIKRQPERESGGRAVKFYCSPAMGAKRRLDSRYSVEQPTRSVRLNKMGRVQRQMGGTAALSSLPPAFSC